MSYSTSAYAMAIAASPRRRRPQDRFAVFAVALSLALMAAALIASAYGLAGGEALM